MVQHRFHELKWWKFLNSDRQIYSEDGQVFSYFFSNWKIGVLIELVFLWPTLDLFYDPSDWSIPHKYAWGLMGFVHLIGIWCLGYGVSMIIDKREDKFGRTVRFFLPIKRSSGLLSQVEALFLTKIVMTGSTVTGSGSAIGTGRTEHATLEAKINDKRLFLAQDSSLCRTPDAHRLSKFMDIPLHYEEG